MTQTHLCKHCQQLMSNQPHEIPTNLSEVNRIYNHTVYHCRRCGAYFGHIHVPYRWQLMLAPSKQYPSVNTHTRTPRHKHHPSIHL